MGWSVIPAHTEEQVGQTLDRSAVYYRPTHLLTKDTGSLLTVYLWNLDPIYLSGLSWLYVMYRTNEKELFPPVSFT